jgi:uncharacterized protein YjbI with pentapeptide repeats
MGCSIQFEVIGMNSPFVYLIEHEDHVLDQRHIGGYLAQPTILRDPKVRELPREVYRKLNKTAELSREITSVVPLLTAGIIRRTFAVLFRDKRWRKIAMNKYVRKLFGVVFQSQQTQQVARIQQQHLPTSSEEWRQHWQSQGQSWRTEPEIDAKRQEQLSQRRAIIPDIEKGIYPFRGMKLSRADVEWLLATHESDRKPVDWNGREWMEREGVDLRGADLRSENLQNMPLMHLRGGLSWREWSRATPEQREAAATHLEGANLRRAYLEKASLRGSHLEGADLYAAHLEGTGLYSTHLEGAVLKHALFDGDTQLRNSILENEIFGCAFLADIRWGDVNVSGINWAAITILGEERKALSMKRVIKDKKRLTEEYLRASRANLQLAVVLQAQGLSQEATHFSYHAQIVQRKILWLQRSYGKWIFSLFLALLTGYGYRMWRILAAYLLIVSLCAVAYFVIGMYHPPHLTLLQAFLESVTAFHGRVFYELFTPDTPPKFG